MTNREAQRRDFMYRALQSLGFTKTECQLLRRISLQLGRWHERNCDEDIRRGFYRGDGAWVDEEAAKPAQAKYCRAYTFFQGSKRGYPIPDRGRGAEARLELLMRPRKRRLLAYVQSDPRGAALYIVKRSALRKAGKKPADIDSCYTMGIAVY